MAVMSVSAPQLSWSIQFGASIASGVSLQASPKTPSWLAPPVRASPPGPP
jgi:hypothetical protein